MNKIKQNNTIPLTDTRKKTQGTAFSILGSISLSHLLNDMIQSLILAIYPLLQSEFTLNFIQIGMITLTYQVTASLLQPLIGLYTDKHPQPYSLPIGMGFTLSGLLLLAYADSFPVILLAAALVGTGSSVFHPESSRVARMASGGRLGLAQSLFQVSGNLGSAFGPLLAAIIIAPYGKGNVGWLSLAALLAIIILLQVSQWYKMQHHATSRHVSNTLPHPRFSKKMIIRSFIILLVLIFSKYFYSHQYQQLLHLLPDPEIRYFSAKCADSSLCIFVCCGLFFGLAFGMGGIGAAVLGYVADKTSIELVYKICAFLPLLGIFTLLLPNIENKNEKNSTIY
ncbi:MFS transporter [Xenorhabdus cabanillasii]|nr:MFS transporter [Xenorhabdus cabanillasii]